MGAFFSSLLGSYADTVRQKHKDDIAKEEKQKDAHLEVLKEAVRSGRLSQEGLEAAFEQMEGITAGGKKKKGGFSFKNLLGQFNDVGGGQGKNLEQATGEKQAEGKAQPQAGARAPAQVGGEERLPQRPAPQTATGGSLPSRPHVFKTDAEMDQDKLNYDKKHWEQVDKPGEDYKHQHALEEIKARYGHHLTQRTKVAGGSVPPSVTQDTGGKAIDPNKPYTVLYNAENEAVGAIAEYEKPERKSGPEAKIESLTKDILAEAQQKGRQISPEQAEGQARTLMLNRERANLYATLENTHGKAFANKVKEALESGSMTPPTAKGIISYVGIEAKRRHDDVMDDIMSGKTIKEIEDDVYVELGTSRDEVSRFLRAGSKPDAKAQPGGKSPTMKFDKSLEPALPARPN